MLAWLRRLFETSDKTSVKLGHPMADGLRQVFQSRLQRKRDIDSEMKRILSAKTLDAPSN